MTVIFSGKQLGKEGMKTVIANSSEEWKRQYMMLAKKWCKKRSLFLSEQFRAYCLDEGLPRPHHPNLWGAMWNSLVKKGWISLSDDYGYCQSLKSHGVRRNYWRSALKRS